jgi:hypothetical protein
VYLVHCECSSFTVHKFSGTHIFSMLHEPLLNTPAPGPTARSASILSSSVTLFKAIVGTGMFALPPAVRETGWALGCVMVVILAVSEHFESVAGLADRMAGSNFSR